MHVSKDYDDNFFLDLFNSSLSLGEGIQKEEEKNQFDAVKFIQGLTTFQKSHPDKKVSRLDLSALKNLPIEESKKNQIANLGMKILFGKDFEKLIKEFEQFEKEELPSLTDFERNCLMELFFSLSPFLRHNIKPELVNIPIQDRFDVLIKAIPLFSIKDLSLSFFVFLTTAIHSIKKDKREEVIKTAEKYYFQNKEYPYQNFSALDKAMILRAIDKLKTKQREDVLKKEISLFKKNDNGEEIANRLENLSEIDPDDLDSVIENSKFLFRDDEKEEKRKAVYQVIKMIRKEERKELIEKIRPLFGPFDKASTKAEILRAVWLIDKEERDSIIKITQEEILKTYFPWGREKADLLLAISAIEKEKRASIVKEIMTDFQNGMLEKFIIPYSLASPEKRKLFSSIKTIDLESLVFLYTICSTVSLEETKEIIETVKKELMAERPISLLEFFYQKESIKKNSLSFMQELFSSNAHPFIKLHFANFLEEQKEQIKISDEDPVFQQMIEVKALLSSEAMMNPKNPYRVHNELKQTTQNEILFSIEMPTGKIDDGEYHWNLNVLRIRATIQKEELKENVEQETIDIWVQENPLQNLFTKLEKRISQIPKDEKQKIGNVIKNDFAVSSLGLLRESFFDKPFIQSLLSSKELSEKNKRSQIQLYCISKSIFDQKAEIFEGQLFSPQEDLLLKILSSIQNCETGQRHMIEEIYLLLDEKYKLKTQDLPVREKMDQTIDSSVQKILRQQLADSELIKEFTEENVLEQEAHQTLFLQNRLYKQIGLLHDLTFDPHTLTLYDRLLKKAENPKQLLDIFFVYLSKSSSFNYLLNDLAKVMTYQFLKDKEIYNECRGEIFKGQKISNYFAVPSEEFLMTKEEMEKEGLNEKEILEIEEEKKEMEKAGIDVKEFDKEKGVFIRLTKEGALALLLNSGYLRKGSTS